MKRLREETTTTTTTTGPPMKRRKYTTKSSSNRDMDIEPGRPGFYTVARTRGPYAKGEMKYFDTYLSDSAIDIPASANWTGTEFDPQSTIDTAPVATPLNLCSPKQGAGVGQRIGREITIHKIKVRGTLSALPVLASASTIPDLSVRLLLVQDCETNAAQCQGEDVMEADSNKIGWLSYQNIDKFGRFKVIKDKLYTLTINSIQREAGPVYTSTGARLNFKWNVNFKVPVKTRFNATNGGTVVDITTNSFHILANSNAVSPQCRIQYKCRVCYKDV
jgi:hypothetical protein